MHIKKTTLSPTKISLVIKANEIDLSPIKQHTLKHFAKSVKVPGFREGKAPMAFVEKHIDQNTLHSHFFEDALQDLYAAAIENEKFRPAGQPQVTLKKFVPFTVLEVELQVEVFAPVVLGNYKKLNSKKVVKPVVNEDVNQVLKSMQQRSGNNIEVNRPAVPNDEVIIDFKGIDAKGMAVNGAEGKGYPLVLGSGSFIPGFEDNLLGLKAGQHKKFNLTFPKNYSVNALANKKVTFEVTVKKVNEVSLPKLDDVFASQAGPFKTLAELKTDIKKQLYSERQIEAERNWENDLIREISRSSKLEVPDALVQEQIDHMIKELKQNLLYRGQSYDQYLASEDTDESGYKKLIEPQAKERVKAGLVLAEISEVENIQVTKDELDIRIGVLKGQYTDAKMHSELDKPEARRDIASRLMSEKTVAKVKAYNQK